MNKRSKVFLSICLIAAMLFTIVSPVMATTGGDSPYTITINNANEGHTYEAYQIFTGDLSGKKLSNIQWGNGITDAGQTALQNAYNAKDAAGVAKALNSGNIAAFAKKAAEYLTATSTSSVPGEGNYKINGLTAGYYLVKDQNVTGHDAHTDYIIKVTDNTEVSPKSSVPTVEKKVQENSNSAWQDAADYAVGDTVPFKLTATLGDNLSGYDTYKVVFHDTLSKGLTFNEESLTVTIDGKTVTDGYIVVNQVNTEDTAVTVTFEDLLAQNAKAGSKIVVKYNATLNDKAVISSAGNPNEVYLEFSNNPNGTETGTTPKDKVVVFTYELDINKVDGEKKPLQGAGFTLYKLVGEEYVAVGKELKNETMTTFKWMRLDAGKYKLEETTTPAGYNTMSPIEFTIKSELTKGEAPALNSLKCEITKGGEPNSWKGVVDTGIITGTVVNNSGSTLPETGGMGTTLFYIVGAFLVVGAAVVLVARKRMN